MISQLCYFLHQSESKEIDEMKRIALVVMRKDRELKNLKKIIYIFLLTDNNQNEMGPTIWLRLFRNAHSKTHTWCMLSLFKFFCKIKILTGWWILMIIRWPHYNCALTWCFECGWWYSPFSHLTPESYFIKSFDLMFYIRFLLLQQLHFNHLGN